MKKAILFTFLILATTSAFAITDTGEISSNDIALASAGNCSGLARFANKQVPTTSVENIVETMSGKTVAGR